MSFIKNYIENALNETKQSINPLEELKRNPYFFRIATYFTLEEKEKLFNACKKLFDDYPILKDYKITLLGIGAETAGDSQVLGDKNALIRLGDNATHATVIHELGHIIAKNINFNKLDLSYANEYEISVYALTNKEEMFCELIKNKYTSRDTLKVNIANKLLLELQNRNCNKRLGSRR